MNESPKSNREKDGKSQECMFFSEMMRKMMDQQGHCCGIECTEMISKMMKKMGAGDDSMSMCKEMMGKMKGECC